MEEEEGHSRKRKLQKQSLRGDETKKVGGGHSIKGLETSQGSYLEVMC